MRNQTLTFRMIALFTLLIARYNRYHGTVRESRTSNAVAAVAASSTSCHVDFHVIGFTGARGKYAGPGKPAERPREKYVKLSKINYLITMIILLLYYYVRRLRSRCGCSVDAHVVSRDSHNGLGGVVEAPPTVGGRRDERALLRRWHASLTAAGPGENALVQQLCGTCVTGNRLPPAP